jgi:hypothetical protein
MASVPDQPSPHHDQPSLAELRSRYPQWTIDGPAALGVYTAELWGDDGRSLHFLAGHNLAELAARLGTATQARQ